MAKFGKKGGTVLLILGAIILFFFVLPAIQLYGVQRGFQVTTTTTEIEVFWISLGTILVIVGYWYRSKDKRMIAKQSKGWDT